MTQKELEVKTIIDLFGLWELSVRNNSSLGLYDTNIFSEGLCCELLNIIFGYNLKTFNRTNNVAIDAADFENRVALQITSNKSTKKINETIQKFISNNLNKNYDELYVFILGVKQKKYKPFEIQPIFIFDSDKHILDFEDLLVAIKTLALHKIISIRKVLAREYTLFNTAEKSIATNRDSLNKENSELKLRKRLKLEKDLKKDFLLEVTTSNRKYVIHEPWAKFKYGNVILRDVNDNIYPDYNDETPNWYKSEFWDFYENGIEFISQGGRAIFNSQGFWDIMDYKDRRESIPGYEIENFHVFARVPFSEIATYDMEPEGYYGYPTIFCHFEGEEGPFRSILYGSPGCYDLDSYTVYFDTKKRTKILI